MQVTISFSKGMDVLYWGGEGNGCYSIKSAYRLLSGKMLGEYDNR